MTKQTSTLDIVALCKSVGANLGECNKMENRAAALKDAMNVDLSLIHI